MKILALLILLLVVVSCKTAPPAPPTYQAQAAVPRAPAVSPHVEGLREATAQADRASAVREDRGERMITEAQRLRHGLAMVVAEADRIRAQEAASVEEIANLWQMLAGQHQIAEALFAEAEHYRLAALAESDARKITNSKIPPLQRAVAEAKSELDAVRLQLIDAEEAAKMATASAETHHQAAAKAQADADKAKGAIGVWQKIAGVASAIALISILIIIFKPRFL